MPGWEPLVNRIRDFEVRFKLLSLKNLVRSPVFFNVVGPAIRLMDETFGEPVFQEMLVQTFDLYEALLAWMVIILLGGPDEYVNRLMSKMLSLRCIQISKAHWARYKEPLPHRIYIDEASTIIGHTESDAMGKTLKMGQSWCLLSQTADFAGDEVVNTRVQQNCSEKIMMHAGAEEVAKQNNGHMKFLLDPYKVHHLAGRSVPVGYEEVDRVDEGFSIDHEGRIRRDTRRGKTQRARHVDSQENVYDGVQAQDLMNMVETMKLGVGECFRRIGNRLEGPFYIPMLDRPFQFDGWMEEEIEDHMQWQLARGILRVPAGEETCQPKKKRKKETAPCFQ